MEILPNLILDVTLYFSPCLLDLVTLYFSLVYWMSRVFGRGLGRVATSTILFK